MRPETITMKVTDVPEFKQAMEEAAAEIKRLRAECDECERRYDWLLARCGGTAP